MARRLRRTNSEPWKTTTSKQQKRESFRYAVRNQGKDLDLTDGQVVLTIPASFDDIARNLTAEAAEAAGLGKV
ncbi:MAG: hypothetical protein WAU59_16525, partial [Rhodoplanes sp.]